MEARSRNRDRLAEVYREYRPFMARYITSRVGERERSVVEDLTQETFIRAWPYLNKVAVTEDRPLYGWLASVARSALSHHHSQDYRANQQRDAEDPAGPESGVWNRMAPVAGEADEGDPRIAALTAAMEVLPPKIREAVELRVAHGMVLDHVAVEQGVSKTTVRSRIDQGLAMLRDHLAGVTPAPAPASARPDPMARARRAVAEAHSRVTPGAGHPGPKPVASASGGEDTAADSVARARDAVAQAHQRVAADASRRSDDAAQAGRVARWYAEDQAAQRGSDAGRGAW